jgi:hypothetical protein
MRVKILPLEVISDLGRKYLLPDMELAVKKHNLQQADEDRGRKVLMVYLDDGVTNNYHNPSIHGVAGFVTGLEIEDNILYAHVRLMSETAKTLWDSDSSVIRPCGEGNLQDTGNGFTVVTDYILSHLVMIPAEHDVWGGVK